MTCQHTNVNIPFIFPWNPMYHDRGKQNYISYLRVSRRDWLKFIYTRKSFYAKGYPSTEAKNVFWPIFKNRKLAATRIMAEMDLTTISELQLDTR